MILVTTISLVIEELINEDL